MSKKADPTDAPFTFERLFKSLHKSRLYTLDVITDMAMEMMDAGQDAAATAKSRYADLRAKLEEFIGDRALPPSGDQQVAIRPGESTPAWYGWRWQPDAKQSSKSRATRPGARAIGRPMKYHALVKALVDETVYTPSTIAAFALQSGFIRESDPEACNLAKQRIRITLGRFSNNHHFPDGGDGRVTLRGQAPTPGWFGWRWKAALKE